MAFCGLARLGAFHTETWLAQLLFGALQRGKYSPDLDWMRERATADFAQLPAQAVRTRNRIDARCVWVLLAGFVSEAEVPVPVYANFSNAHPAANRVAAGPFYVEVRGPMTPREREVQRGFAMSFGAVLVDRAHVDRLRRVVDSDRTPAAAVGSALRTIRAARQTEQGSRLVGERCGSAIVWSERERQPEGWYHGPHGARTHYMPTLVTRHGVRANVAVDRLGAPVSRNAACPCGSGRPFRQCHGARSSGVRGAPPRA